MLKPYLVAAALLAACPAKADLLQVDIYGIATANVGNYHIIRGYGCPVFYNSDHDLCTFINEPYHFTAVFDTTRGVLSSPQPGSFVLLFNYTNIYHDPASPLVSALLTVTDVGTFRNFDSDYNLANMSWQDDGAGNLSSPLVNAGAGYHSFSPTFFQSGVCPGMPCSRLTITSSTLVNLSAVPGPIAGAGLPGLLVIGAFLLRAFHQRSNQ